ALVRRLIADEFPDPNKTIADVRLLRLSRGHRGQGDRNQSFSSIHRILLGLINGSASARGHQHQRTPSRWRQWQRVHGANFWHSITFCATAWATTVPEPTR